MRHLRSQKADIVYINDGVLSPCKSIVLHRILLTSTTLPNSRIESTTEPCWKKVCNVSELIR
jgi:hypothetical protein